MNTHRPFRRGTPDEYIIRWVCKIGAMKIRSFGLGELRPVSRPVFITDADRVAVQRQSAALNAVMARILIGRTT